MSLLSQTDARQGHLSHKIACSATRRAPQGANGGFQLALRVRLASRFPIQVEKRDPPVELMRTPAVPWDQKSEHAGAGTPLIMEAQTRFSFLGGTSDFFFIKERKASTRARGLFLHFGNQARQDEKSSGRHWEFTPSSQGEASALCANALLEPLLCDPLLPSCSL